MWLRAALDHDLYHSGGRATEQSDRYFEELTAIYHADNAEFTVAPPSRRALRRLLGE